MAQHGQNVASSQKALMLEMKSLQEEPVEGFKITLVDESDLYNWEVAIFGPPNTHYEGGYFKFPVDYPYSPPAFRFLTKMWHPNIYEVTSPSNLSENDLCFQNGDVCISILHPPVDDPQSGELPSERWNPTQNVRKQVQATKADADRDGVKVPVTLDEYCVRTRVTTTDDGSNLLYDDYYDDEELEDDDDEDENEDFCYDEDDSGTEDS
uniref:UBC core domain-containing protein n=1 Tax=Oryzias melastigma TaxID=30732 RepID=A0A3B3BR17_ORYME